MSDKYRINPDFVVPAPTGARHFCTMTEEEFADLKHRDEFFDRWREDGVQQIRVTIVNDEYPHELYPHGVWIEGWDDPAARMLPFGQAEGSEWGPIYPPLVDGKTGKLWAASGMEAPSGGETAQTGSTEGDSPTAATSGGDAQQQPPSGESSQ